MKKGFRLFGILCLMTAFLCIGGCDKPREWGPWADNGLQIDKDGTITMCIVDEFDRDIYELSELRDMANAEVDNYNGKGALGESAPVTVQDVARLENDRNMVRVVYKFEKPIYYSGFMNEELYFETVSEALSARHIFSGAVMFDKTSSITMDETNKSKLSSKHVLITNAKNVIRLPYDALYYSYGVEIGEDGTADTRSCSDMAVIIMKD